MKKAKKLLVTLLILTFMLSTFNVGFAADNDVTNTAAVDRAQALGILKGDDQGNLNLDKPITRAEALALIIRISGLETSAELMKGQTRFADANIAPSLQWATGYINLGVSNNIVNGFPDGTFRGNDTVTYAEMAKMLIYAMNYGVAVDGAPWPAGVMAKADDLKLFDKVNAVPNIPAVRGDVVQMIDNALPVKHLVQKGYGDLAFYEEGDEDFLYKLRIIEVVDSKGDGLYVEEIARVNNKLDDDEIQLSDGNIYTLKTDIKAEEIFGKKVKVWVKRDDNKKYKDVFYVKVDTAEKDILFDAIVEDKTKVDNGELEELELKIADKKYKVSEDAKLFINYEEEKVTNLSNDYDSAKKLAGLYGNFVLERGEVVFANLFDFDKNDQGLVTKVEKDIVEFVALEDAKEDELDLDDYDEEDIYVYDKNFKVLSAKDIKEDSLIYYWTNDDDEIFIVVAGDEVEGEIDRVRDNKVRLDSKSYDKADSAIVSYDKGKNYDTWVDVKDVEDLTEEKVWALLGLDGNIAVIRGDAVETSDTIYGVVTHAKVEREGTLSLFNKEGKVVDYTAEKRSELTGIAELNYYDEINPETGDELSYAIASFKVNRDGEITEDSFDFVKVEGEAAVSSTVNADEDQYAGKAMKSKDKAYIEVGGKDFYLSKDTVIISAINKKELDPNVISYDDLVEMTINSDDNYEAVVFGKPDRNAKLIVFLNDEFKGSKETYYFGIVAEDPWVGRKSTTVEINVAGKGKAEYKLDKNEEYFKKGNLVAFTLNSKDEADLAVAGAVYGGTDKKIDTNRATLVAGTVQDVDGSFVKINNKTYKFASDAVIYDFKLDGSKFKLDGSIRMSRISENDYVVLVFDEDEKEVKAAAIYYEKDVIEFNK